MTTARAAWAIRAAAASLVLLAVALAGCTPRVGDEVPSLDDISAIEFFQTHDTVDDFDDDTYRQRDEHELRQFVDLLDAYDVDPETWRPDADCTGVIATHLTIEYAGSTQTTTMEFRSCDRAPGFSSEATYLVGYWAYSMSPE